LKRNKVEFNILTLVNNLTVKKAKEIYNYHKEKGFFYHQYIPCVEYDENNNPYPFSITGDDWGTFLCEIFDEWIKQDVNKISIRVFDSIIEYLVFNRYNVCNMQDNCCQYFVVEHDGNVYPCDFFVRKDLVLGNVLTGTWDDFLSSSIYHQFGKQKAIWNDECNACPYLYLCHGGCQKNRVGGPQSSKTLSVLCQGWKRFYTHALSRFEVLAKKVRAGQHLDITSPIKAKKIGRNEPCPCGSGKKYKNCCMK
jgi:uncharacterized protein